VLILIANPGGGFMTLAPPERSRQQIGANALGYEMNWPSFLNNEFEIARYIRSYSQRSIPETVLTEYFRHSHAKLKYVQVSSLVDEGYDDFYRSGSENLKLGLNSAPVVRPLVVGWGCEVISGGTLLIAARERGELEIWAYVPAVGQIAPADKVSFFEPRNNYKNFVSEKAI